MAEAAKNAEAAEQLRSEIAELKAQGESDRIDFSLQLAGVRNVKAARAILADHGGDLDALREAEPWLFADAPAKQQGGRTGLPNAGTSTDAGKTMRRWRRLAGLDDSTLSTPAGHQALRQATKNIMFMTVNSDAMAVGTTGPYPLQLGIYGICALMIGLYVWYLVRRHKKMAKWRAQQAAA